MDWTEGELDREAERYKEVAEEEKNESSRRWRQQIALVTGSFSAPSNTPTDHDTWRRGHVTPKRLNLCVNAQMNLGSHAALVYFIRKHPSYRFIITGNINCKCKIKSYINIVTKQLQVSM